MAQEPKQDKIHNIFQIAKTRFPHIDFQILNPELTFAQNLHNIISQLGLPSSSLEVTYEITNMKEAVDRQQLKIQTSLVNDENIDMSNRTFKRHQNQHYSRDIEEQNEDMDENMEYGCLTLKPAVTRHQEYHSQDIIMEEIWMFDEVSGQGNAHWFQN